jgi:hypothetical protein
MLGYIFGILQLIIAGMLFFNIFWLPRELYTIFAIILVISAILDIMSGE